jgi:hypothetical protein
MQERAAATPLAAVGGCVLVSTPSLPTIPRSASLLSKLAEPLSAMPPLSRSKVSGATAAGVNGDVSDVESDVNTRFAFDSPPSVTYILKFPAGVA